MGENIQVETWSSEFGKNYTDRNIYDPEALNMFYLDCFRISRLEMNRKFLSDLNLQNKKILEVGCNVGNQLSMLQKMGFDYLYGVELQWYAVERAKELTKNVNIIQGIGDDLPFKDNYFDMVFTSGVLIHISPDNIGKTLDEIYRCSKEYIWGFEYYADNYTQVVYRGDSDLLWKTNFAKLYLDRFPDLELMKEDKFKYQNNRNIDTMFLLRKKR